MDAQKWKHLFFSVGLPLIGWVLSQFYPAAHDALCSPLQNINRPQVNVLTMSDILDGTYRKLEKSVDKKDWGDYPSEQKGGWA